MPVPAGITAKSWRLLAIFLGTIVGSIVRPVPAGAIVFLGVAAVAFTGTLTPAQALGGYADPIVWLVLCAFFISRGVVKTGLGRRIALVFIRAIGHAVARPRVRARRDRHAAGVARPVEQRARWRRRLPGREESGRSVRLDAGPDARGGSARF